MKKLGMAAALCAALLLSSCASGVAASPNPVGTWGATAEGQPQLVLEEGGTLHGTDGCNRLVGTWEESNGTISFGPMAGTRMFCEGADPWLADAASGKIVSGALELMNDKNVEIGTLKETR